MGYGMHLECLLPCIYMYVDYIYMYLEAHTMYVAIYRHLQVHVRALFPGIMINLFGVNIMSSTFLHFGACMYN